MVETGVKIMSIVAKAQMVIRSKSYHGKNKNLIKSSDACKILEDSVIAAVEEITNNMD